MTSCFPGLPRCQETISHHGPIAIHVTFTVQLLCALLSVKPSLQVLSHTFILLCDLAPGLVSEQTPQKIVINEQGRSSGPSNLANIFPPLLRLEPPQPMKGAQMLSTLTNFLFT